MERPEDVAARWDRALAAKRPCLVHARVDPSVPPLPPHITKEQAKGYLASILKGDPQRGAMLIQSWRAVKDGLFPDKG